MNPHPLQLYRVARGWTQAEVAERIGVAEVSIGRWERGEVVPLEIYCERLVALFEASAQDLGLAPSEHLLQARGHVDPVLPIAPHPFVGHEHERTKLRRWLVRTNGPSLVAVSGLPGVGKTALVLALLSEAELRLAFEGMLWASLGPHPQVQEDLVRWARLLRERDHEGDGLSPLLRRLRARVGARRLLLLLDDVWDLEIVAQLRAINPYGLTLLTTRSPALAAVTDHRVHVPPLSPPESIALLRQFVPRLSLTDPAVGSLAEAVGGLPLALVDARYCLHPVIADDARLATHAQRSVS